jgi:enterochelin esterase-like enzyme
MVLGLALTVLLQGGQLFSEFLVTLGRTSVQARASLVSSFLQGRQTPLVERDSLLHFVWFGPADSVLINGALQRSWSAPERMFKIVCGDSARSPAFFYRSYTVPPDARIEYKFIVDGVYRLDPTNRRVTPPGDFVNSEASMPGFGTSPVSAFRPDVPHGTVDTVMFSSTDPAIRSRRVRIYVPPGYKELSNLPVIYVHDGASAFTYLFFANIVDNMIADGTLPPILGVFVPPVEREREYRGSLIPAFIHAFCEELVPLIDRTYRTAANPGLQGVMGISSGGHIALTMSLARPDRFSLAAAQSSPIGPILRTALMVRQQGAPLPATTKLWIDCGAYDMVAGEHNLPEENRQFSEELRQYGIAHRYREVHDGHDWSSWRERTPEILRYFFVP